VALNDGVRSASDCVVRRASTRVTLRAKYGVRLTGKNKLLLAECRAKNANGHERHGARSSGVA
jgi:hypothetical protein